MILENPDPQLVAKWGPLGWVSDNERQRILNLPFGLFKPAVAGIEKEIKAFQKKQKARESEFKRLHRYTGGGVSQ